MTPVDRGLWLEVELLSPLVSSGAAADSAVVDRDVAFDASGLPVLPARRMKGLLRESWEEIAGALEGGLAARLFGKPGESARGRGAVRIADGRIGDDESAEWISELVAKRLVTPSEVLWAHCERRVQTAISSETGGPIDGTLRVSRLVRRGLTFRLNVATERTLEPVELDALALAAAALKRMGLSRTRGPGEVKCRLLKVNGDGKKIDLTGGALERFKQNGVPSLAGAVGSVPPSVNSSSDDRSDSKDGTPPTHVLPFRILLTARALLPSGGGDPNLVETNDWIPGGAILGAIAWLWVNRKGRDEGFRRVFVDGGVRFLDAFLEAPDDSSPERLLPVPCSVRRLKADPGSGIDLAESEIGGPRPDDPLSRLSGRFGRLDGELGLATVATELRLHHANANDLRFGRALGSDVPGGGAFFAYESVSADQAFRGALIGSKADLETVRELCPSETRLAVGRSINAEYGGSGLLTWGEVSALESVTPEWAGWRRREEGRAPDGPLPPSGPALLRITCLSRLVGVNEQGHPVAGLPLDEIRRVLSASETSPVDARVVRCWTRSGLVSGFRGHLRVPRAQVPCLLAGSVFELSVSGDVAHDGPARLEREGLGLRKEEGFGRVAVNRHGRPHPVEVAPETDESDEERNEPAESAGRLRIAPLLKSPGSKKGPVPKAARDVIARIFEHRVRRTLSACATGATAQKAAADFPSGSLLGRVKRAIAQNDAVSAARRLDEELARKLSKIEIELPAPIGTLKEGRIGLCAVLSTVLGDSTGFLRAAMTQELKNGTRPFPEEFWKADGWLLADEVVSRLEARQAGKVFAAGLVSGLSRRRRKAIRTGRTIQDEASSSASEVADAG